MSLIAASMVWPIDPIPAYWRRFTRPGQSALAVSLAGSTYKLSPVKSITLRSTGLHGIHTLITALKALFGALRGLFLHSDTLTLIEDTIPPPVVCLPPKINEFV